MIHTPKLERAIHRASLLHRKQVRKGEDELPYITHLFSVFIILAKYTNDEDILISGLLHDTLEDTPYTAEELEKDFGPRIRSIVEGVSEQKTKDGIAIDWEDRKRGYVQVLETGPEESLYVSAADKIHNFQSTIDAYQNNKERYKKDFVSKDRILFYGSVVEVIVRRLGKEHQLALRLQEVFDKYKAFLESVYTTTPAL